jgi:photosystem II stability/assembly factor-like uncharacterized protein
MPTAEPVVQPGIEADLQWRPTSAPAASSRYDDIWFVDPETGWAVNSNGDILATENGGGTWQKQFHSDDYLRCVGFANRSAGWVGTLGRRRRPGRLYRTRDGGKTWDEVRNLPQVRPPLICGLCVVNDSVIYASGTNEPTSTPPAMIKSTDGGETWTGWDMTEHATILIDTFFSSPTEGWVVGGKADKPNPTRDDIKPVVLHTRDGGETWTNRIPDVEGFPFGEWGWKIQFLNEKVGFVALENFTQAAILKTTDGGCTWVRLPVNDPQRNANLEGIGFVDEEHGWVGGWGDANFAGGFSSATSDGGGNWRDANEIGRFINRFRFFGNPVTVGYSSGRTVYKYSSAPVPLAAAAMAPPTELLDTNELVEVSGPIEIAYTVPEGASRLAIDIWNRFGVYARLLLEEKNPRPGRHSATWDLKSDSGESLPPGFYLYRITVDEEAESRVILFKP